jgi:uncharacterized protein YdeI (YjbR/CyaY-like superfamily)
MEVRVFRTQTQLRGWLERNHARRSELWIGFYRKGSGRSCVSYSDALDLALCFGWIDGVRKKVDEITYTNRFSPRTRRSVWSLVNIRRAEALIAKGAMHSSGLAAFAARTEQPSVLYTSEREIEAAFEPEMLRRFQNKKRAWAYFQSQAQWYRRTATHWVMSAKRPETRARRFAHLLERSATRADIGPGAESGKIARPIRRRP